MFEHKSRDYFDFPYSWRDPYRTSVPDYTGLLWAVIIETLVDIGTFGSIPCLSALLDLLELIYYAFANNMSW